jgi:DNA-binding NarL/FixJ family response regulator
MSQAIATRILIADDHELVRMGIRAVLSQEPDMVVCGEAITGTQALAKALELKPDVMILDIGLPELNGVEVTRRVRGSMSVAVLIVTMHDSDQVVQAALEAGASGYLLKSDVGRALPAALRAILAKSQFVSDRVRAAADLVLPDDEAGKRRRQPERLTSREREVLQRLAEGCTNKEIAAALGITTKTAETHRARIMAKLDVHSMSELVRYAIRNQIIEA